LKIVIASSPLSLKAVKLCLECNTRKADNDKEEIDRRCCICNAIPILVGQKEEEGEGEKEEAYE
jgi:hypothetical protein